MFSVSRVYAFDLLSFLTKATVVRIRFEGYLGISRGAPITDAGNLGCIMLLFDIFPLSVKFRASQAVVPTLRAAARILSRPPQIDCGTSCAGFHVSGIKLKGP